MVNADLQERISLHVLDGYRFLGKDLGEVISEEDAQKLLENNKMDSFYAGALNNARWIANLNGKQIGEETGFPEVIDALVGVVSEDEAVSIAAGYYISMHRFTPREKQVEMEENLVQNVLDGVPYAGIILRVILKNKSVDSYASYKSINQK